MQGAVDAAELLAASTMPAAHQRSAIWPFCQFFTLREWVRAMEIIDSMLSVPVERNVRKGGWHAQAQHGDRLAHDFA